MTDRVARIVVQNVLANVFSPYDAVHVMRAQPGRRWDNLRKCWVIPTYWVNPCADALRALGITVYCTWDTGEPFIAGHPRGHHGRRDTPAPDWIEAAFADCPAENVAKLRAGLLRAFHPDAGGDHHLAQRINAAAGRRGIT